MHSNKILYTIYAVMFAAAVGPCGSARSAANETLRLDVKGAEEIAIKNSAELQLLQRRRKIQRMLVKESRRAYFPSASVSYNRSSDISENEDDMRSRSVTLNLEQVVYDGGRRSLALKATKGDFALGRYDLELARNELRLRVRQAFYGMLSARAQIAVLKKSIKRQEEQLRFARRELELGETTEIEVLEIENRVNEIVLQEKNARMALENGVEEFKLLLCLKSAVTVELQGDILSSVTYRHRAFDETRLIAAAFDKRIEFKRSRIAELKSLTEYQIAKSYYLPAISVGGFYGFTGDRYPPREREWGLNFRVTMLLGANTAGDSSSYSSRNANASRSLTSATSLSLQDRLDYRRGIVETGAEALRAKTERAQLSDRIRIEVKRALQNYRASWEAMQLADKNIMIFERRMQIAERQVALGDTRRTDLAETEIRYLEAINAQIGARLSYMTAAAGLETALGLKLDSLQLLDIK